VAITDLIVDDNVYRKRKGIYRIPISDSDEVSVNDGCHDYLIRSILPSKSPAVPEGPPAKKFNWKHGAFSLMVHMLFLAVLTVLPVSQIKDTSEPETRFVQVDPQLLEKAQEAKKPTVKPPPKKPKAAKPAAKPVKKKEPVKKKASVKKSTTTQKKPAKVSKKPKKAARQSAASKSSKKARKSVASKHPNAGGGYGKGNTSNRNVNQVGILSMLGDSKVTQVQPAVANVTNLDAVKSANSSQAKFKVGGIKGKLGTSEISVAGGEVVATKGNSQVLRSYGAGGDGRVAALEKGKVGQKKVMGMVQARLNKSVKIRGGMSREAVKRVIEQHLDEITYCYETALISNPSIKGKITMEWKILMSGAVGETRIKSSTVKSPEIYGCIKSAIKTWQFPSPTGNEVVVSYPFIFDIVGF
jgi:outer membrane biosynthesis protein TonB